MNGMKAVRNPGLKDGTKVARTIAGKIGVIVTRAGLNKALSNTLNRSCCRASRFQNISPAAQPSGAAAQASGKTESTPRPRPSTEYSIDPSAFSAGSMVLPGETLAKYGKDKQQSRGKSEAQPEHQALSPQQNTQQNTPQNTRSVDFFRTLNPPVQFPRSLSRKTELKRAWKRPEFFTSENPRQSLRGTEEPRGSRKLLKRFRGLRSLRTTRQRRTKNGLKG